MPVRSSEIELKLLAPSAFELPDLSGLETGVASSIEQDPLDLSAVYFDTPGFRLMQHGITLRYRSGEAKGPVWTLKLPGQRDDQRDELDFPGEYGQPPQAVRDLLFGVTAGEQLRPVAEIKTRRRVWALMDEAGDQLAELVDDRVTVLDGNHIRDSFREIEVEAISARRKQLHRIAGVISEAGANGEQRSKASRAIEALYGPEVIAAPRMPSPKDPARQAVAPALQLALRRLTANDPAARLGEIEGVHQLRVGARRLRSVMRTFKDLLPDEQAGPIVDDLRWLGRVVGEARDLDVMIANLEAEAAGLSVNLGRVQATLVARRAAAQAELLAAISSERYIRLIREVEALILTEQPEAGEEEDSCRDYLPELVAKAWRKLREGGRALAPSSPEEDFHRVRILAKRARYAAETVAVFTKSKEQRRLMAFAAGAEQVQNVLGEGQDATVARDTLSEIAGQFPNDGRLGLALGRLIEREDQKARRQRAKFYKTWRKLDRRKTL